MPIHENNTQHMTLAIPDWQGRQQNSMSDHRTLSYKFFPRVNRLLLLAVEIKHAYGCGVIDSLPGVTGTTPVLFLAIFLVAFHAVATDHFAVAADEEACSLSAMWTGVANIVPEGEGTPDICHARSSCVPMCRLRSIGAAYDPTAIGVKLAEVDKPLSCAATPTWYVESGARLNRLRRRCDGSVFNQVNKPTLKAVISDRYSVMPAISALHGVMDPIRMASVTVLTIDPILLAFHGDHENAR
jgi:hypothetical protein